MTSNHYALTYSHEYNWLVLTTITLIGALIRIYFVGGHRGKSSSWPIIIAAILIGALAAALVPASRATTSEQVSLAAVRPVIEMRCTICHSAAPTHSAFPTAPGGVILDTDEQILAEATRIHQQTVVLQVMPIGNLTEMSAAERALVDAWYLSSNE
jgi:uncharacterized membrane protein